MSTAHHYADLLRALDGMRNLRAIVTVIAGFILAFAVVAAGIATGNAFGAFLFGLIGWLVAGFGSNAAGVILMHQALEQEPPTIGEALLGGMTSFLKLLAIFIILALIGVAYTLVVALLLFACKIPFAGPVLYALLVPVIVIVSGAGYFGLVFGAGLMAPAVWRGASIQQALSQLFTILRQRLIETIVRYFMLILLLLLVFGVVMAIIGVGLGYTMGLSVGILGAQVGGGFGNIFGGMMGSMGSMGGLSGSGGYAVAGIFGFGIVYALVLGLGFCVATMGGITIYLAVSEGLDSSEAEAQIAARVAQARQQAAEMEQRMRAQSQPAPQPPVQAPPPYTPPVAAPVAPPPPPAPAPYVAPPAAPAQVSPPPQPLCPACRTIVAVDDVFCGNCGHRLR